MIRVLIAEDSAIVADILRTVLERDPEIIVVGRARHGAEALAMTRLLRPTCLTMDVRMPVMDGIEATAAIMEDCPVPILIVSDVGADASVAFRAIQAGAIDVVQKPCGPLSSDYASLDLVHRLKMVAQVPAIRRPRTRRAGEAPVVVESLPLSADASPYARVLAVAASTGGPPALATVLSSLPRAFPSPILAVQHIAHGFLDGFVEWLASTVKLDVRIAERGEIAESGKVYFAPEDRHLGVSADGRLTVLADPPCDGHRPSATVLFENVARAYGARAVGVLLTGMGADGAAGLKLLRTAGGRTICQDEATSVIFGMPKVAIELGAAERVLAIDAIAAEVAVMMAGAR